MKRRKAKSEDERQYDTFSITMELERPLLYNDENNTEKKAYITNAPNCIEYLYANQWSNGSTIEIVYETSSCVNSIGSIDPYEKATPIYRENGILHVVYSTAKGINTKSGYVKYNGGFNKF